jgi:SulP family sulfate permease
MGITRFSWLALCVVSLAPQAGDAWAHVRPGLAGSPRLCAVCMAHPGDRTPWACGRQPLAARAAPAASDSAAPATSQLTQTLAGVTVALASIPTSIAFANIVGVSPLVGIWSSVVLGLAAPALGARPGLVFGAAGVVVVPLAPIYAAHGADGMALTLLLAALLQAAFGALRLGSQIALVSPAVMTGFLNGLGLLLVRSQLGVFTHAHDAGAAVALSAGTMALIQAVPKLSRAVPASLCEVVVATVLSGALALDVETLEQAAGAATFAGGLAVLPHPLAAFPALPPDALADILTAGCSIAFISLIETLLSEKVLDGGEGDGAHAGSHAGTHGGGGGGAGEGGAGESGFDPNASCLAMAAGNAASALLGGLGGCGVIPITLLNQASGGGTALSCVAYGLAMSAFVLVAAPLVGKVPLAALAGVMLTVGVTTLQWRPSWDALAAVGAERARLPQLAAIVTASAVCFKVDMAAGIVLAVLVERALALALESTPAAAAAIAEEPAADARGPSVSSDVDREARARAAGLFTRDE